MKNKTKHYKTIVANDPVQFDKQLQKFTSTIGDTDLLGIDYCVSAFPLPIAPTRIPGFEQQVQVQISSIFTATVVYLSDAVTETIEPKEHKLISV